MMNSFMSPECREAIKDELFGGGVLGSPCFPTESASKQIST